MKKKYVALVVFVMLLVVAMVPEVASAALTVHTFPDESNLTSIKNRNILDLSYSKLDSYSWHGVKGSAEADRYNSALGTTVKLTFLVPMDGTTSYTDFLDLYFKDVGETWEGRKLNATIHFDSIKLTQYNSEVKTEVPVCFCRENNALFAILSECNTKVKFTLTVTYADTGEVLDMPMLQALYDIDIIRANYPSYAESWELNSGYSGELWVWDSFQPSVSGNKVAAAETYNYTGDDSWLMCGGVAPTINGEVTMTVIASRHVTSSLQLSLANDRLDAPVKESNGKDFNIEGDNIEYTITQKMGLFYGDTMCKYNSFVISDTLPEGVKYISAKIYDANNDITSKGTLKYDADTREVSFAMGSAWLGDIDNYKGQNIVMKIDTEVEKISASEKTITNTATTLIDNGTFSSNQVQDVILTPYKATYKYVNGTEGKELPSAINVASGAFKVSDSKAYYRGDVVQRQNSPEEGTQFEVKDSEGNLEGTWVLSWDADNKTVGSSDVVFIGTWKYIPSPRLVISKRISYDAEQFTEAHGNPTFLFKVTGKDSGKVWYKAISFTENAVDMALSDGFYTGDNGEQFEFKGGYVYGTCEAIYLPEDDYIVEELNTIRFDNTFAIASYDGEETRVISSDKDSVTVPLKLSTYGSGDAGYNASYASVLFDNTKINWSKYSHTDEIINKLKDIN